MSGQVVLVTITNWIVSVGSVVLLGVIVVSQLASYRIPKAMPVGPGRKIFTLPLWVQIISGLFALVLFVILGCVLWIPLLFLLVMLVLYRRAQREEMALAAAFGEEWYVYARRVPMLMPRRRMKLGEGKRNRASKLDE